MKFKNTPPILFWNVDTQNDFMKVSGKLYVQNAEEIESTIAQLTRFAEKYNIKVLNTCDYHNKRPLELSNTPDFIATFPPHCIENTKRVFFKHPLRDEYGGTLNEAVSKACGCHD